ncbi:hypothetical protein [Vibrio sinaloensis]|uniref:hypothetical protein n=1 Tax=Photobacterium sp. (strain ATCC 43367) TaxID=379097 RepID=UPI00057E9527|nr:hypothetical protein [Vibrio sinaloensis]KHT52224.1 hypothetical protein RJ46_01210 [Vibrio sinaloensis]
MKSSKVVGLLCPSYFGYHILIEKGLINKFSNVICYDERPSNNFLVKALLRLGLRSLLFPLLFTYYVLIYVEFVKGRVTHLFVINPESVPRLFIKLLKKRNIHITLYMWDSFENKKYAKSLVNIVDDCYSFDLIDCSKDNKVNYLPLFYSKSTLPTSKTSAYDLSFVGTLHSDRYQLIKSIEKQVNDFGLNTFIYLYHPSKFVFFIKKILKIDYVDIKFSDVHFEPLPYTEVLNVFDNSFAILDMQHPSQSGLTMRTIETLGARKKLITSNPNVALLDFFDERNILVLEREQPTIPRNFFDDKYLDIPTEVYEKYSLDGWLSHLTGSARYNFYYN